MPQETLFWIYESNGMEFEDTKIYTRLFITHDRDDAIRQFQQYIKEEYRFHRQCIKEGEYVPKQCHTFANFVRIYFRWNNFPQWDSILNEHKMTSNEIINL